MRLLEENDKIQMVDLKRQYQNIKPEIDAAIQQVLNDASFVKGPIVKDFESDLARYLKVEHVISCANGTDALQIAFMALNLQPGDEVIVPSFTYVATAEVLALLGLKPVMVDVYPETFNIDISILEGLISSRTKAIVPVHLFGQCADMESLLQFSRKYNLFVIEDTAQALGAEYTFSDGRTERAGCMGDIGTTSFFPSKNLGAYGDGGAIMTNNSQLAEKLRIIANHGQTQQYIHDYIGVNSRLDSIQAAILKVKLKHLDEYAANRQELARFYTTELKSISGIITPVTSNFSTHVFHQYTLRVNSSVREDLKEHLKRLEIPSMIYYPIPLHKQAAFSPFNDGSKIDLSITEALCTSVISLPMHTEMNMNQREYIVDSVIGFFKDL